MSKVLSNWVPRFVPFPLGDPLLKLISRSLSLLACLAILGVTTAVAEIYRWTDADGEVHYTDNPGTIPPDRRAYSRREFSETPRESAPAPEVRPPQATPAPALADKSPRKTPSEAIDKLRQREQTLKQQIETARQEREGYLEQLKGIREIRTNPAFGQRRRRADELGRSLAAVEQHLDTLQSELRQVQTELQEEPQDAQAVSPAQGLSQTVTFDQQGHDRTYWQRRLAPVRTRLTQAQEQRQAILKQLDLEPKAEGSFGRRGQKVLELTRTLTQVEQEIREAEATLQALRQESSAAGAPAAWLQ